LTKADPGLAEFLSALGRDFQAKVHRLHHQDPLLCWDDEGPWESELAVIANPVMNLTGEPPLPHNGPVHRKRLKR